MSGESSPPILKYVLLFVALAAWLISVAIFVMLSPLVFTLPSLGLALVMLGWLAANLYAADLMIKVVVAKGSARVARDRSIAAAVLSMLAAGFALFLLWGLLSFATAF
ncbi:MAG: hypothetical protein NT015_15725 [Alphaproteobacteria bacterium]|nr:hypothetical protein [Alphaproteobacteria bacterium]